MDLINELEKRMESVEIGLAAEDYEVLDELVDQVIEVSDPAAGYEAPHFQVHLKHGIDAFLIFEDVHGKVVKVKYVTVALNDYLETDISTEQLQLVAKAWHDRWIERV
jgi:hypothetical protein